MLWTMVTGGYGISDRNRSKTNDLFAENLRTSKKNFINKKVKYFFIFFFAFRGGSFLKLNNRQIVMI